jgi:hypothetical protein
MVVMMLSGEPDHGKFPVSSVPQNSGLGRDLHHGSGGRRMGITIDWMIRPGSGEVI